MTGADVALCILGCRSQSAALERRTRSAMALYRSRHPRLVVACGGIAWAGEVEADAIARRLEEDGVPAARILRDRTSRDTQENAIHAAKLLEAHRVEDVLLVTCTWHLRRATRLFERVGLRVEGVGVVPPDPGRLVRLWWPVREGFATVKDLLVHRHLASSGGVR